MTKQSSAPHAASSFPTPPCYQVMVSCILLITPLCFHAQLAWAQAKCQERATGIADHYSKSVASQAQAEKQEIAEGAAQKQAVHPIHPAKLNPAIKRKVLFSAILAKSKNFDLVQQRIEPILNEYACGDLKLLDGISTESDDHLLSRINRTTTALGEAVLATLLITPTSDLTLLRHRQDILQALLANPLATDALKSSLQTYQDVEQSFLSFWPSTGSLDVGWYPSFEERVSYGIFNLAFQILYPCVNFCANFAFYKWIEPEKGAEMDSWYNFIPFVRSLKILRFLVLAETDRTISNEDSLHLLWRLGDYLVGDASYRIYCYWSIKNYQVYSSRLCNLALRMADVQTFIAVATQVSTTIAASPALEKVYGKHLTSIRQLLAQSKENTPLGRLIYYLQHLPFQHWSCLLNNAGKLLASHNLFIAHKDAFADAMYELGQLDAYLSLATLVQEAQAHHSNHAYTFVQFLDREQKDTPYIKIEEMWSPFFDAKQAVGNSLEMDGAPGGTRNIILTGPNAGGKSTFLIGVANTLLLAHVAGIGPAQTIQLTPFNKINAYINVTHDIATDKPLFIAEVDCAQKHINILKGLQPYEFSFTIFDDPFRSTNPIEGAAAEYSILEALGEYPTSLSIVATHYPTAMLLAEKAPDKGFANYKAYIIRDSASGKINYTYKIVPGRSDQAIAIDILAEQGYDTEILKRAREIIENPAQYQADFKEN